VIDCRSSSNHPAAKLADELLMLKRKFKELVKFLRLKDLRTMPQCNLTQRPHLRETRSELAEKDGLTCARWMTSRLHTVKPHDSVARARAILEEHRINQLPVVKDGILVGIVTDRDLRDAANTVATCAYLAGTVEPAPQAADEIPVEMVMTQNVITLAPHSSIVTAAELMRRERIGSLPIVDGRSLVGLITRSDILQYFVSLNRQQPGEI
jgi:CBS domain-containing protein